VGQIRHRLWHNLSALTGALQVVATLLHCFPRLVYPSRPTTTTVVVYISNLGPSWVALFGATSLGLAAALYWKKHMNWAHLAAAVVWVLYTSALITGAVAASGTWLFPAVTAMIVALHAVLASGYDDSASREARR
jgi:hypothetical protein